MWDRGAAGRQCRLHVREDQCARTEAAPYRDAVELVGRPLAAGVPFECIQSHTEGVVLLAEINKRGVRADAVLGSVTTCHVFHGLVDVSEQSAASPGAGDKNVH